MLQSPQADIQMPNVWLINTETNALTHAQRHAATSLHILQKSSHVHTSLDYKQARDVRLHTCPYPLIVYLLCCMGKQSSQHHLQYNILLLWLSQCFHAGSLLSLMHSLPLAKFQHLCAQVQAHCTLLDVASLADGRQQRGDITGMGFEMVRSSVYSA